MDTSEKVNKYKAPTPEDFGLSWSIYNDLKRRRDVLKKEKLKLIPSNWLLISLALLIPFLLVFIFTEAGFWGSFWITVVIGVYTSVFFTEASEFFANIFSFGKYNRISKEIDNLERPVKEAVAEFEEAFYDYFQNKLNIFYSTRLYRKKSGTQSFDESLGEFKLLLDELSQANEILLTKRFSLGEYESYFLKRSWDHSFRKESVYSRDASQVSDFIKKVSQASAKPVIVSPEEKYRTPRKIDWDSVNKNRQRTGLKGEEIAVEIEKDYLISIGKTELAEKVCHMAKEYGDGLGYDILSFFPNGNEKYVEVKSTTGSANSQYFISKNELEFLASHKDNAFIYRVQILDEADPYLEVRNYDDIVQSYELVPVQYAVRQK